METRLPSGTVTFLFTDIEGSTRMAHSLGDEYRAVLHDHRKLLRGVLGRSDGAELLTEGDSFFVAFDDAATAITAAIETQRALAAHPWPYREDWTEPCQPRLRIGIHTGPAMPRGGEYATHVVHRAARVRDAAHGGQVLCSEATLRAAARRLPPEIKAVDLGLHRLRGFDDPERLMQLVVPDLESQFPPPRTEDARGHNLPSYADFIGREAEIRRLRRLVEGHRLVTATGPSGVGKTRVAVETARRAARDHPDGVWYADLPAADDPALAGRAIARAIGVRPDPFRPALETALDWLRHRRSLLLLDGARPVHGELARRVLAECWQAKILLISRAPLGLSGEVVWAVPAMTDGEAVRLLELRAAAARGGEPVPGCAAVARRLGGLPLALELAAARLRIVGPVDLAARLDEDLLGVLDGTDRTWSAALDASYDALPAGAVALLHALAATPDPVDVDDVERLADPEDVGVLDALAALVDASLLDVRYTGTAALYRVNEPVRAYAAARAAEGGRGGATVGGGADRAGERGVRGGAVAPAAGPGGGVRRVRGADAPGGTAPGTGSAAPVGGTAAAPVALPAASCEPSVPPPDDYVAGHDAPSYGNVIAVGGLLPGSVSMWPYTRPFPGVVGRLRGGLEGIAR